MSSVTITEITETNNGANNENNVILPDKIEIDEKGEETDNENSDAGVKTGSGEIRKKKKKVKRELSTRDNIKKDAYSSSDEVETRKQRKDNLNKTIIRRRKLFDKDNKNEKGNTDRSKRGKSEPPNEQPNELNENRENKGSKKSWWPWNKLNKNDTRQVQTDGEGTNRKHTDSESDEFWKSSSFRKKKSKNKSETNITKETPLAIKNDKTSTSSTTVQSPIKSLITKEILTDTITVEIVNEAKEKAKLANRKLTWIQFKLENFSEYNKLIRSRNKCMTFLILLLIYLGVGALSIRFIEGTFENFYKCGVKRVKRDFIDMLWDKRYGSEDEWKSIARKTLMNFENELHVAFEAGIVSYSGQQSWSFINSFLYCLTVITTIGYGNITPHTHTGRAFTIAYAIIGIPLFLIVLADFGKLFTRGIKFLWAYVRRLYYTGSCRQVRRTAPVQEFMKGVKMVSDVAQNLRRPSQMMSPEELRKMGAYGSNLNIPETGGATPALSSYEIDEEFNLPISLALLILLGYILCGATVFCIWEDWTFFESCYFVFISMSTIGFGDIVPKHRMYMMASIVYLLFGLALTSMCINVVQEKLSNSFRQASAKLGATIGFQVEEDTGLVNAVSPPQSEIPEVHQPSGGKCKKS